MYGGVIYNKDGEVIFDSKYPPLILRETHTPSVNTVVYKGNSNWGAPYISSIYDYMNGINLWPAFSMDNMRCTTVTFDEPYATEPIIGIRGTDTHVSILDFVWDLVDGNSRVVAVNFLLDSGITSANINIYVFSPGRASDLENNSYGIAFFGADGVPLYVSTKTVANIRDYMEVSLYATEGSQSDIGYNRMVVDGNELLLKFADTASSWDKTTVTHASLPTNPIYILQHFGAIGHFEYYMGPISGRAESYKVWLNSIGIKNVTASSASFSVAVGGFQEYFETVYDAYVENQGTFNFSQYTAASPFIWNTPMVLLPGEF